MLGEGEHGAEPAGRPLAGLVAEQVDAVADGLPLLVGRHIGEQGILRVVVAADVVTGFTICLTLSG